jgi:hypothetical protein
MANALNGFLGRPRRALALADRKLRAEAAKVAGSHVVKILEFFAEVYQDKSRPDLVRLAAADRLLDRALGRPTSSSAVLDADAGKATRAHVYRFSWLPSGPNDHSVVIEPS